MRAAQSGNGPPKHSRARRIAALLLPLLVLYLSGFAVVYAWSEEIDVSGRLRRLLGLGSSKPTIITHEEARADVSSRPATEQKQRPDLLTRDVPVSDDLPVSDELTEGIDERILAVPAKQKTDAPIPLHADLPAGIALSSPFTPVRCWDARGFEHLAEKCDSLYEFNQLLTSKMTHFLTCRDAADGRSTVGRISLFIEADFVRDALSLWTESGAGQGQRSEIVACVQEKLKGAAIAHLPHRHSRYRLSGQIRFVGTTTTGPLPVTTGGQISDDLEKKMAEALRSAKEVSISRERVRVRKTPVDGEIIGFLSKPAKVKLLEKSDDWCLVKTKRENIGWMVCWGLATETPAAKAPNDSDAGPAHVSPSPPPHGAR